MESSPETALSLPPHRAVAETAAEILEHYEASAEACELLTDGMPPAEFLDRLREQELHEDAITFLAYALGKREALWWGLRCVREGLGEEEPAETIQGAVDAVQAWVDEPGEDARYAAFHAAEAATYESPAGCLALAVFFNEGSMAPADCPAVPVDEWFCARTLAASIHVGYLGGDPKEAPEMAKRFLELGLETATQPAPWESEQPGA